MRATDKLSEARFFLEKLKEVEPGADAFRFYLSAAVNASRSVTWVLQADLRPAFGEEFDDWWKDRREDLAKGDLSFPILANLRNTLVKKGHRLPRKRFTETFAQGPIESVELLTEGRKSREGFVSFNIILRPDHEDTPSVERSASDNEREEAAAQAAFEMLRRVHVNLQEGAALKLTGLILDEDQDPMRPEGLVTALEHYLDELEELLNEAEATFRTNDQ